MKSRFFKMFYILLGIAAVVDWPVKIEAQGGAKVVKSLGKVVRESKEGRGLFKSCSSSEKVEEGFNNSSRGAGQMNVNPAAVGAGMNAVRNTNSNTNSNSYDYSNPPQEVACPNCGGEGWIPGNDGYNYPCQTCGGHGTIIIE